MYRNLEKLQGHFFLSNELKMQSSTVCHLHLCKAEGYKYISLEKKAARQMKITWCMQKYENVSAWIYMCIELYYEKQQLKAGEKCFDGCTNN